MRRRRTGLGPVDVQDAGSEIDLTVIYQPVKFLAFQAGYSHFFAGDYLRDTGADDDADFGYVQATVTF